MQPQLSVELATPRTPSRWSLKGFISLFGKRKLVSELADHFPTDRVVVGTNPTNRYDVALQRVSLYADYRPYRDARHPYGYLFNRPIIGEHSRLSGGIFISAKPAEAIVIDEKYELLRPLLSSFRARLGSLRSFSIQRELEILEEIFELSNEIIEWSEEKVLEFNRINHIRVDTKVALDLYLDHRIGVNRHKVLIAAYIIERLREDGHLTGVVTIPATMRHGSGGDEYVTYMFPNGVFATLDPTPPPISETYTSHIISSRDQLPEDQIKSVA